MLKLWQHYIDVFRRIIASGWLVVKRSRSPVRYYVYPHSSLPTKWRMSEAIEIQDYANGFNDVAGTSKFLRIQYNVITEKGYYLWHQDAGRVGRGRA